MESLDLAADIALSCPTQVMGEDVHCPSPEPAAQTSPSPGPAPQPLERVRRRASADGREMTGSGWRRWSRSTSLRMGEAGGKGSLGPSRGRGPG